MPRRYHYRRFNDDEREEIWRRATTGEPLAEIAVALDTTYEGVRWTLRRRGGVRPRVRPRSPLRLSLAEREEISRGLRAGESERAIGRRLRRAPSTISREVAANGGRASYRAVRADARARRCAQRPKVAKLARQGRLRAEVEHLLARRWSPQQIARRLARDYPDQKHMRVSHETIYQSLFVQSRGALRRELTRHLRSGRSARRPARRVTTPAPLREMLLISQRPAEVADRAVPGHWEGDLLIGRGQRSAIGTLVERQTRFVMLLALPDGRTAPAVRNALTRGILALPEQLRRSLTWDQGREMAEHRRFTVDTGVQVYFCDPHSPWQRGSNENTNGLLRQYFPKGTDLSPYSQAQLDAVAAELNDRPRQTLDWLKPCEALANVVAMTD
jgi:IS30 family transposase